MIQKSRWQRAQEYERAWWQGYAGDFGWYRDFSREVLDALSPFRTVGKDTAILEIGPGPAGGITFLDADRKFAVEPLADYFDSIPEVRALRDPRVQYRKGRGEDLPFADGFFDLIIIDNVLDHCENPGRVLDEMDRVLAPGGHIFLRQNVYHFWGRLFRRMMETAQVDRGHPHTFGMRALERGFCERSWAIRSLARTGFAHSWRAGLASGNPKQTLKSALLVNSDRVTWVLEKAK